jgi:tRNA A-37 threonylcarbamoyl transferase component Bud32
VRVTPLKAGDELAGYRVLEFIAAGGMGRVYRAVHPVLERVVALKVIRPEIAADETFRDRFRREARLIASIDHPSVVPVYDADEVDGVMFIAMRWVAGSDLRRLLATEGRLEPARAVHLLRQLTAAAEAGHRQGLVHRDIKPANVLLEGDRVFLSDFGVARLLPEADASTTTGGFVGTVDYAAPELLDGEAGTPEADIYALGCVLYELLTGSVPFPVESLLAKLNAHANGERPMPSERRPELPRGLDEVVGRCLATEPGRRFATAGELGAAAERALLTPAVRMPRTAPELRRRRRPGLAGTLLSALMVAAAAASVAWILGAFSPAPSPYAQGGRRLPAPGTLAECGNRPILRPVVCRNPTNGDGVMEIGYQGQTVSMSTMNVEVTGVALATALTLSKTGGEVTAPSGTHFLVVDLTVTNLTSAVHEFESSENLDGRLTMLMLLSATHGKVMSISGPRGADYSVQYSPALAGLQRPLYQAVLPPGQPIRGQLVFYYPNAEITAARHALLEIKELGEAFSASRSEALISIRL